MRDRPKHTLARVVGNSERGFPRFAARGPFDVNGARPPTGGPRSPVARPAQCFELPGEFFGGGGPDAPTGSRSSVIVQGLSSRTSSAVACPWGVS